MFWKYYESFLHMCIKSMKQNYGEWIETDTLKLNSPKKKCLIYFNESPLINMKNAFYFILKALFVLKIFKPLCWSFILFIFWLFIDVVDSERWTLDSGPWTLDAGLWMLDAALWTLGSGLWTLNSARFSDNTNNHMRTPRSRLWIWTYLFLSRLLVLQN